MNINSVVSGGDIKYVKPEMKMQKQAQVQGQESDPAVQGMDSTVKADRETEEVYYGLPGHKKDEEEVMANALKQANKTLAKTDRYIEREIHEKTHAVIYKLKDSVTGEVIAEFPPKKIQDMVAKMWELAGLFVDEKA